MSDDLAKYRAKRRFDRTAEPSGAGGSQSDAIFVVQKHAARRLHYDLRLQVGDTLKSWAVPEGPCLDPKIRRFAKQVEDHPLEYAHFEGRIAEGEYGAGEMMVWDHGDWVTLAPDPATAIAKGELKFRLSGKKLQGGWMLKQLPNQPADWLLIKERDIAARPLDDYDVLVAEPNSVLTGLPIDELKPIDVHTALPRPNPADLRGAIKAALPARFKPQLATAAPAPPSQAGWLHEIKYDGYRTLCFFDHGQVRLVTRNGLDWTARYAALAETLKALPCDTALLDGEIVVQDPRGVATLDLLEQALSDGRSNALTYYVFDLCHLDGFDLTPARQIDRKHALEALISPIAGGRSQIQLSEHVEGDGAALYAHACRMGVEGVVSKRADARYVQERTENWLKIKRVDTTELVVIGFSTNTPKGVSALILAEETPEGLRYACRAGSGIGDAKSRELFEILAPAKRERPVIPTPRLEAPNWVEPRWTAEIAFRGRSGTGAPRQPTFLSLADRQPKAQRLKPKLITDRDLAAIHLTNPDREMLEGSGVTKLDLALYYAQVGDWMLPELLRRPVTLIRCPTGRAKDLFYQRHAFPGLPEGVEKVDLAEDDDGEVAPYITITEPKGFLAMPQFGAVEFHLWGCRVDDPEHPDRLVFDLDPDEALPWSRVCDGAEMLRARLQAMGATPFLRTTGGKGVHLVLALKPEHTWKEAKGWAESFARMAAAEQPETFIAIATKAKRRGKIFIDYLRNGRGASAIASYSLRAKPAFPVAAPIAWSELRTLSGADAFDRKLMVNRLERLSADPWDALQTTAIRITPKMRRDVGMKD